MLLALLFGVSFLVLADLTLTWLVMLLLALGMFVLTVWSGDPTRALYSAFVATVSIAISKGLVAEGGVYEPGLSVSLADPFLFGFLVLWLFDKLFVRRERFRLDPAIVGALLLTLYLALSISWAVYPFAGGLALVSHVKYFAVLVAVVDYVRTPALIRTTILAIAFGLCINLAMVAAQVLTGGAIVVQGFKSAEDTVITFAEAGGGAFRPYGFLGHPNTLGGYLVFLIPPMFALVLLGRRHIGRTWFVSLLLLMASAAALVLSLSRQAWIACPVSLALLLVLGYARGLVRSAQLKALVAVAVGVTTLTAIAYPAALLRIVERDQGSTQSRLVMNDQALLIIEGSPILGVGLGSYTRAAQTNIPESFANIKRERREVLLKGVVHNKWLLITAELGLVGLALFLVATWLPLRRYLRRRTWSDPVYAMLALGLFCSLAGTLVIYAFDNWRLGVPVEIFWLYMAFLLVVLRLQETGELPLTRA
jgi:O-antigen ligase